MRLPVHPVLPAGAHLVQMSCCIIALCVRIPSTHERFKNGPSQSFRSGHVLDSPLAACAFVNLSQYFDVDTVDVKNRLVQALVPKPGSFVDTLEVRGAHTPNSQALLSAVGVGGVHLLVNVRRGPHVLAAPGQERFVRPLLGVRHPGVCRGGNCQHRKLDQHGERRRGTKCSKPLCVEELHMATS